MSNIIYTMLRDHGFSEADARYWATLLVVEPM